MFMKILYMILNLLFLDVLRNVYVCFNKHIIFLKLRSRLGLNHRPNFNLSRRVILW